MRRERKDLVISVVIKIGEKSYKIKAVSQQQKGGWMTWRLSSIEPSHGPTCGGCPRQGDLGFMITAMYVTLPSPHNMDWCYSTEKTCKLFSSSNLSLQHILSGRKVALKQGRYKWRHFLGKVSLALALALASAM